jgi:hypothetical protein
MLSVILASVVSAVLVWAFFHFFEVDSFHSE